MEQLSGDQVLAIISIIIISVWSAFLLWIMSKAEPRESSTDKIMKGLREPMWQYGRNDQEK